MSGEGDSDSDSEGAGEGGKKFVVGEDTFGEDDCLTEAEWRLTVATPEEELEAAIQDQKMRKDETEVSIDETERNVLGGAALEAYGVKATVDNSGRTVRRSMRGLVVPKESFLDGVLKERAKEGDLSAQREIQQREERRRTVTAALSGKGDSEIGARDKNPEIEIVPNQGKIKKRVVWATNTETPSGNKGKKPRLDDGGIISKPCSETNPSTTPSVKTTPPEVVMQTTREADDKKVDSGWDSPTADPVRLTKEAVVFTQEDWLSQHSRSQAPIVKPALAENLVRDLVDPRAPIDAKGDLEHIKDRVWNKAHSLLRCTFTNIVEKALVDGNLSPAFRDMLRFMVGHQEEDMKVTFVDGTRKDATVDLWACKPNQHKSRPAPRTCETAHFTVTTAQSTRNRKYTKLWTEDEAAQNPYVTLAEIEAPSAPGGSADRYKLRLAVVVTPDQKALVNMLKVCLHDAFENVLRLHYSLSATGLNREPKESEIRQLANDTHIKSRWAARLLASGFHAELPNLKVPLKFKTPAV